MHKYDRATTKYKDVPNAEKFMVALDKLDTNEADSLGMLLSNLSMPQMCCSWVSEEHFNNLLES